LKNPLAKGDRILVKASALYVAVEETLETISGRYQETINRLEWASPFVLPGWMMAWWKTFTPRSELRLFSVKENGETIGIAPLLTEGGTARFIGSPDVCDHLDFVVATDKKTEFCGFLINRLKSEGVEHLDLGPVRPDSVVMTALLPMARAQGLAAETAVEDVLFELALPASWDGYLALLSGKQRHEVRRKLRRLEESGPHAFRMLDSSGAVSSAIDDFLVLFRQNRKDKARFMDERMEAFFRSLAAGVPGMRIGFLDVDGMSAATVLCCDYRFTRYLYNSGYDADLGHLSVGILCKLLSIREGIGRRLKAYDFLKGEESYKRRLGGKPVPIHRCRIDLSEG
jgi:CelD/BcsL family acetyltransferase involved in cellulose biosynthesis